MNGYYIILIIHALMAYLLLYSAKSNNKGKYYNRNASIVGAYVMYVFASTFRTIEEYYDMGGGDAIYYKLQFQGATSPLVFFIKSYREEIGYKFIVWCIRQITPDYRWFLFLIHSIVFFSTVYFILNIRFRQYKIIEYIGVFLILGNLFQMYNLMRSCIVISFAGVFFVLLEKKRDFFAFIIMIVSLLLHTSAVILFLVYFVYKFKLDKRLSWAGKIVMLFLISLLEFVFLMYFSKHIPAKYSTYNNNQGIALGIYVTVVILLFIIWKCCVDSFKLESMFLMLALACLPANIYYSIAYRMTILFLPLLFKMMIEIIDERMNYSVLHIRVCRDSLPGIIFCTSYLLYRFLSVVMVEEFVDVGHFLLAI